VPRPLPSQDSQGSPSLQRETEFVTQVKSGCHGNGRCPMRILVLGLLSFPLGDELAGDLSARSAGRGMSPGSTALAAVTVPSTRG
jgi:hypothetical protein